MVQSDIKHGRKEVRQELTAAQTRHASLEANSVKEWQGAQQERGGSRVRGLWPIYRGVGGLQQGLVASLWGQTRQRQGILVEGETKVKLAQLRTHCRQYLVQLPLVGVTQLPELLRLSVS